MEVRGEDPLAGRRSGVFQVVDCRRVVTGRRLQNQQPDLDVRALAATGVVLVFDGRRGMVVAWMRMRMRMRVMVVGAPRCARLDGLDRLDDLMLVTTAEADDDAVLKAAEDALNQDGDENQ